MSAYEYQKKDLLLTTVMIQTFFECYEFDVSIVHMLIATNTYKSRVRS